MHITIEPKGIHEPIDGKPMVVFETRCSFGDRWAIINTLYDPCTKAIQTFGDKGAILPAYSCDSDDPLTVKFPNFRSSIAEKAFKLWVNESDKITKDSRLDIDVDINVNKYVRIDDDLYGRPATFEMNDRISGLKVTGSLSLSIKEDSKVIMLIKSEPDVSTLPKLLRLFCLFVYREEGIIAKITEDAERDSRREKKSGITPRSTFTPKNVLFRYVGFRMFAIDPVSPTPEDTAVIRIMPVARILTFDSEMSSVLQAVFAAVGSHTLHSIVQNTTHERNVMPFSFEYEGNVDHHLITAIHCLSSYLYKNGYHPGKVGELKATFTNKDGSFLYNQKKYYFSSFTLLINGINKANLSGHILLTSGKNVTIGVDGVPPELTMLVVKLYKAWNFLKREKK